jgi:hypothetical protein
MVEFLAETNSHSLASLKRQGGIPEAGGETQRDTEGIPGC